MMFAGGGLFMWLIVLLVVGLVVYFLVQSTMSGKSPIREDAQEILKKRYARGEISKDEFEKMKKDLA